MCNFRPVFYRIITGGGGSGICSGNSGIGDSACIGHQAGQFGYVSGRLAGGIGREGKPGNEGVQPTGGYQLGCGKLGGGSGNGGREGRGVSFPGVVGQDRVNPGRGY